MDSTPASPIPSTSTAPLRIPTPPPHCPTTVLVPVPPKPHVYATIAMLEHDSSPPSSPSPSPEPTTNPATAPPPPSPSTPLTSTPDQGASTDISSPAPVQVLTPPEEIDPLHIMPGTPQQLEIAPPATHLTHRAHSSSSSPEPLPQTVSQPPQEPSPELQGSASTELDDNVAATITSQGPLPAALSPTVRLTRDEGLDEINRDRNFREVSKEMDRIFRDV